MKVPRPNSLVPLYRQLSDLSDQMFTAAQARQWLTVLALGQRYTERLEALRKVDRRVVLTREEQALRQRLLLRVIDMDARTRRLVKPADEQIDRLLGASLGLKSSACGGLKEASQ